jgi:hypothetical protein
MKQLLYSFDGENRTSYFVAAMADRVFVGSSRSAAVVELVAPSPPPEENPSEVARRVSHPEDEDIPPRHVQAVAGCCVESSVDNEKSVWHIYCGVARQNKSLSIYQLSCSSFLADTPTTTVTEALTLHQTPKRVSSMAFTKVPGASPPLTVVITGDLAGDAFAYSLTQGSTDCTTKEAPDEGHLPHRRLLLGHTASMLTSVAAAVVSANQVYLLTADRDEKIRVTVFPQTYDIHGFLFGHEAFVSCMAVFDNHCFSCGGDRTLRVWDFVTCRQKACWDLQGDLTSFQPSGVPCEMSVGRGKDGYLRIAVIYDQSPHLDIFQITLGKDDGSCRIHEGRQITLPGQPLGLSAPCGDSLVALLQQPYYLKCFGWDGVEQSPPPALQAVHEQASKDSIAMPLGVLERDKEGNLKMIKNNETRGPAINLPWNDYKRKETASKKRSRSNKRRNEKQHKGMAADDGTEEQEDYVANDKTAAEMKT